MAYILMADDDELLGEVVRHRLRGRGHRVSVVGDAETFSRALSHGKPDVAVLDVIMPGKSGAELLRELKENNETADLPVIMLSACRGEGEIVGALRSGAADYLTKPFVLEELLLRVEAVLARTSRMLEERGGPRPAANGFSPWATH